MVEAVTLVNADRWNKTVSECLVYSTEKICEITQKNLDVMKNQNSKDVYAVVWDMTPHNLTTENQRIC
jgi:hypothetical protein